MVEVEFTPENIEKCLCNKCNVQGKSQCVKDNMILLQEKALSSSVIEPEEFPAMYCASGKEHCHDLDENGKCLCPDCSIYIGNDLGSGSPESYFCLNGRSIGCYLCKPNSEDLIKINNLIRDYYMRVD
jgi:Protein of unknown function (DUF2769).